MLSASPLKSLLPICHLTYPLVFPLPSPNPAPAALPSAPLVSPVFPSWASYLEGILCYSGHNFFERDTGGQGMSMVNDRFPIRSIPYVYLQTAATPLQGPARTPTPGDRRGQCLIFHLGTFSPLQREQCSHALTCQELFKLHLHGPFPVHCSSLHYCPPPPPLPHPPAPPTQLKIFL